MTEVRAFLAHPQAEQIMLGGWFYDKELPIPSAGLMSYFIVEMLFGDRKLLYFQAAHDQGIESAVPRIVGIMRSLKPVEMIDSVSQAIDRLDLLKWKGLISEGTPWWLALRALEDSSPVAIEQGARKIIKLMIEGLLLRAVVQADSESFQLLTDELKGKYGGDQRQTYASDRIALKIVEWYPHLAEKLGRCPSKSELKEFIIEASPPGIADTRSAWAEAFKLVRLPVAGDRSRHAEKDQLVKLAVEARKAGPDKVRRKPNRG